MKTGSIISPMVFAVAVFLFLSTPSLAEFYRYRDANGIIRFTDNLGEVPPDQRPEVDSYAEPKDFEKPKPQNGHKPKPQKSARASDEPDVLLDPEDTTAMSPQEIAEMLIAEKAALDAEYQEIQKIKEKQAASRKGLSTPASFREFNTKNTRLMDRAAAYEKRRKMFEVNVKLHNADMPADSIKPVHVR